MKPFAALIVALALFTATAVGVFGLAADDDNPHKDESSKSWNTPFTG